MLTPTTPPANGKRLQLRGLYPATITPFREDFSVDDVALERHLRETANVDGVNGLVINAGLAEILQLTLQEQIDIIKLTLKIRRPGQLVVTGLVGHSYQECVETARALKAAGAEALLVFPPFDIRAYRRLMADPAKVKEFFALMDREVGLPMIIFQYPPHSGSSYPVESLVAACEVPSVVAIKAASGVLPAYAEVWDRLNTTVSVLAAVDSPPLLDMLMHGSHGALIGISAIVPEKWVELLRLCAAKDRVGAEKLFRKVCMPIMESVFENQLPKRLTSEAAATKEALAQLGQIPSSRARMPAVNVTQDVRDEIHHSLIEAGLLEPMRKKAYA